MSVWRQVSIGIRALAGPSAADRDIADEVGHYLEEAAAARESQGLSPDEARRAVRLDLGNAAAIEEQIRDAGWEAAIARTIEALSQDIRFSLRSLRRTPVVALAAIATLTIGIGATTAIFGVVNAVLVRPLPYADADRLISLSHAAPGVELDDVGSAPFFYFTEREATQTFESVGLWSIAAVSVTAHGEPEKVRRLLVTHEILPMLGVTPLLGRTFSREDDSPDRTPTVMLMHGYWQRRFAGDPAVVGQRLTMDGRQLEIIGVMPRSFRFLDRQVDVLSPMQLRRADVIVGGYFRSSIARLKPGVTLERASADVARLIPVAMDSFPFGPGIMRAKVEQSRFRPNLKSLKADVIGDVGATLLVLMITVGIVLLIACANVANLLLVRTDGRQQELLIRAAVGAGSRRLARGLFTESMMLSVAGGVAGAGLAYGILRLVATFASDLPRVEDVTIDATVLLFACALTLTVGLLFGVMLVIRCRHPRLAAALRVRERTLSSGSERHRARGVLVTVQVALALVLLIGGGLMLRTSQRLSAVDPGFTRPDELQTVRIEIPAATASEPEAIVRLQHQVLDRLAAVPGVTAVAYASGLPIAGRNALDFADPEGRVFKDGDRRVLRQFRLISPGLFASLGTPIIAGRDLSWTDVYDMRPVVLISESLARQEWGGAVHAVGKRLQTRFVADQWREIIGVVGDVHDRGINQPAVDLLYVPTLTRTRTASRPYWVETSVAYVIRSQRTGTPGFLADIQQAIWSVNPSLPLANARTMSDIIETSLSRTTLTLLMLLLAGAMALVLGVIGIYSAIAYAISQRTREVGVRIALGAGGTEVRRLFVRQGMALTTVGVVIGLGAASLLTRGMTSLLFEVRPLDPATYTAVTVMLVIASALAIYVPARRATQIDPIVALRAD